VHLFGGTIPEGKAIAAGEIRGASIQGGTRQTLSPGDVVHIPAKTPHNVIVEPGAQLTYFILKVRNDWPLAQESKIAAGSKTRRYDRCGEFGYRPPFMSANTSAMFWFRCIA
jgi:hypothetical protein